MPRYKLSTLLAESAKRGLIKQKPDGSMPRGQIDIYSDDATPVKNTSHWATLFFKVHEITGDKKFLNAGKRAVDYILSKDGRPRGYTFYYRSNPDRYKCGGLVCQARTIESLIAASRSLKRKDLLKTAAEVFLLHPFDDKKSLWYRREIDGKVLPIDPTFNHQLWFAAVGSLFAKESFPDIDRRVGIFLEKMYDHLRIHRSGLIRHTMPLMNLNPKYLLTNLLRVIKDRKEIVEQEVGYHLFNLYAFGILKNMYPNLDFWSSPKFLKILNLILDPGFEESLVESKFGFSHNVSGIEAAFALSVFVEGSGRLQQEWIKKQLELCFDFDEMLLSKRVNDPDTMAARIYEATRLPDLVIDYE